MAEPASPWRYEPRARRFRDTRTGKWLSPRQVVTLRDTFVRSRAEAAHAATLALAEGGTIGSWLKGMRRMVKETYAAQYLLGRGGQAQMKPADWGRVGAMVKVQYRYLDRFARALAAGQLSLAQAAYRATLYAKGSTEAHSKGQAVAWEVDLPAHPGDGNSECLASCLCYWSLEQTENGIEATWQRTAEESCPTCLKRADTWNPLSIPAKEEAA